MTACDRALTISLQLVQLVLPATDEVPVGHGTGRLKSAVRKHLESSPYVSRAGPAEPDDGGDAFTILWIKS